MNPVKYSISAAIANSGWSLVDHGLTGAVKFGTNVSIGGPPANGSDAADPLNVTIPLVDMHMTTMVGNVMEWSGLELSAGPPGGPQVAWTNNTTRAYITLETIIDAAIAAGIDLMTSAFISENTGVYPTEFSFTPPCLHFDAALAFGVGHLGSKCNHYIINNERNLNWSESQYAAQLHHVGPLVKAANPNATVWTGGIDNPNASSWWLDFMNVYPSWVTDTGGPDGRPAFCYHYYGGVNESPEYYWRQCLASRQQVLAHAPTCRFAITEFGYANDPVNTKHITEAEAAIYYPRMWTLFRGGNHERIANYQQYNTNPDLWGLYEGYPGTLNRAAPKTQQLSTKVILGYLSAANTVAIYRYLPYWAASIGMLNGKQQMALWLHDSVGNLFERQGLAGDAAEMVGQTQILGLVINAAAAGTVDVQKIGFTLSTTTLPVVGGLNIVPIPVTRELTMIKATGSEGISFPGLGTL